MRAQAKYIVMAQSRGLDILAYAVGGVAPVGVWDWAEDVFTDPPVFARGSAGYGRSAAGHLVPYANDTLRRDFGMALPSILVEPATENVLAAPACDLTDGRWATTGASVQQMSLGAMGLFDGVEVVSQGAGWNRLMHRATPSITNGQAIEVTAWLRLTSSPVSRIVLRNTASRAESHAQLSGGAMVALTQAAGALFAMQAELQPDGVTWKIAMTMTPNADGALSLGIGPGSSTAGEAIIALAAQVETGAVSTTFTQGVRAQDVLTLPIPTGTYDLRYVRGDGSAHDVTGAAVTGPFQVPTDMGPIAKILAFPAGTLP